MKESSPLLEKPQKLKSDLDEAARAAKKKLQIACLVSLLFMLAEVVGGFFAGSLAIMTDAAHLLSDVAGFLISIFSIWAAGLPASSKMSYGFQRAEVVGAVLSVLFIWVLTGCLVYAAVQRFIEALDADATQRVDGKIMFIVACIGVLVNICLMTILDHGHSHGVGGGSHHGHSHHGHSHQHGDNHHGHSHGDHPRLEEGNQLSNHSNEKDQEKRKKKNKNINIRAAYIHALGDLVQSVGVCLAGAIIWYNPKYQIADPIATFVFSILVLLTTVGIIKESVHVLMEGTPAEIDALDIETGLRALPGVVTTHDLHIWSLTMGNPSLSVHIVSHDPDNVLESAQDYLLAKGIIHATIQVEHDKKTYPRDCTTSKCGQTSPRKN